MGLASATLVSSSRLIAPHAAADRQRGGSWAEMRCLRAATAAAHHSTPAHFVNVAAPRCSSYRPSARGASWFRQECLGGTPPAGSGSCHRAASIGVSTSGRLIGRSTCFVLDVHSSRLILTKIHCNARQPGEYREVDVLLSEDTKRLLTTRNGVAVLIHWGPEELDGGVIDPGFFGRNRYTTDLRSRGDKFAMYYIRDEDAEEIVIGSSEKEVSKVRYEAELPLSDIYEFNTDPLRLISKAEESFRRDWGPTAAFGPNEQAEYIGEIARELGFTAMILEWRGSRRVDVFVPLTPTSGSSSSCGNSEDLNSSRADDEFSSDPDDATASFDESTEISSYDDLVYASVLAAAVLAVMLVFVISGQNLTIDATSRRALPVLKVQVAAPSSAAQQE